MISIAPLSENNSPCLFSVKTSSSISILKNEDRKTELYFQIDPFSLLTEKVNAFIFPENEAMIYGTFQGTVYEVCNKTKNLKTIYLSGKGLKTITHMTIIPNTRLFVVFQTDKSFYILNRDLKDINNEFISFVLMNSNTKSATPSKKKKKSNFVMSTLKSEISQHMEYEYSINKEKNSNPVMYGKLYGGLITYVNSINFEGKDYIGVTDRDGYMKMFELPSFIPYRLYKSEYGGFNSFTYEPSTKLLAISGEDDAITIINLENEQRLRILGHQSFVTSSFFYKGSQNKLYLLAGSLDGHVSLTKIHSLDWNKKTHEVNYKEMLNIDGVGMLGMISNKFFFSCYDGVIGIYDTEIVSKRGSRKVNRELHEKAGFKQEDLTKKLDRLNTEGSQNEERKDDNRKLSQREK